MLKLLSAMAIVLLLACSTGATLAYGGQAAAYTYSTYAGPALNGKTYSNLPPDTPVNLAIFLQPSNFSNLVGYSVGVSEHTLPPLSQAQVSREFSPAPQRFMSLESYLTSNGFVVNYVSSDRFMIDVTANASVVDRVFHTTLRMASNLGVKYYFPAETPSLPVQLSGLQVTGLENLSSFTPSYLVLGKLNGTRIQEAHVPHSLSFLTGYKFAATYYGPGTLQNAYNATRLYASGYKGQGQTIAVVELYGDPEIQQDVAKFDSQFGLPAADVRIIPLGRYEPSQGVSTGWDIETALDVETVHSMAPLAKIDLVVSSDAVNGLYEAIDYVVSNDLANITSMSWGLSESLLGETGFYSFGAYGYSYPNLYFALGSDEGISFFAASGDGGSYGGTPTSYGGASFPSSSPFVTSVGGTTLYSNDTYGYNLSNGTGYMGESAWSLSPQYFGQAVGSGGGSSILFPKPWYQDGVVSGPGRATPDVSADANPYTGLVIVAEGVYYAVGGTSLATPTWAGATALLDQFLNTKLGLLNPLLYEIYADKPLYSQAFNTVYFGTNG
ncbi:MAG: protease pro-enzyme activation domain-containing protein, partial [Thermoprotei archaeon]